MKGGVNGDLELLPGRLLPGEGGVGGEVELFRTVRAATREALYSVRAVTTK